MRSGVSTQQGSVINSNFTNNRFELFSPVAFLVNRGYYLASAESVPWCSHPAPDLAGCPVAFTLEM